MKISPHGLAIIKGAEGLRLEAYLCPAGIPTIGYGSTRGVVLGDTITEDEAEQRLKDDVEEFEGCVADVVTVPLTQGQFDALVSLSFNIGCTRFANSTLVRLLNAGDIDGAAAEFSRWVKSKGQTLPGLVRRRQAERERFVA